MSRYIAFSLQIAVVSGKLTCIIRFVVLDGKNGICREVKPSNPAIDKYSCAITLWHKDVYAKTTTNDTHRVWIDFGYFSPEDEYYAKEYELDLRFLVRSDSPYVWIKFLCYDSLFVSPETTVYLIEEPFPLPNRGASTSPEGGFSSFTKAFGITTELLRSCLRTARVGFGSGCPFLSPPAEHVGGVLNHTLRIGCR